MMCFICCKINTNQFTRINSWKVDAYICALQVTYPEEYRITHKPCSHMWGYNSYVLHVEIQ